MIERGRQSGGIEIDEITLKLVFRKLKGYAREVARDWIIVLLITAPLTAYLLYNAWKYKPAYTATLTFMLNDAQSGGQSGIAAFLGQLSGTGDGQFNLNKIVELAKSRRIMAEALFQKGVVDGVDDYYANHFIRDYDFHAAWKKDTTGLNGFFFKSGDFDRFDRLSRSAFVRLYDRLTGKTDPLFSSGYSKSSNILELDLKTHNEDLSIQLTDVIYAKLSEFYINNAVEKQEHTVDVLKNKMDSLKRSMQGKEYTAAKMEDVERGLLFESDKVKSKLLKGEVQLSGAGYSEIVKNFEIADFNLKNSAPFIRAIDLPFSPILPEKPSKLFALMLGASIGLVASAFIILFKNAIKE